MTALIHAISQGGDVRVASLLDSQCDYLFVDLQGWTALHWAVSCRHAAIVKMLLKHHFDNQSTPDDSNDTSRYDEPSSPTSFTYEAASAFASRHFPSPITPIELAAQTGDLDIFRLLLSCLQPFQSDVFQFNAAWPPVIKDQTTKSYPHIGAPESARPYLREADPWNSPLRLAHLAICDSKLDILRMFLKTGIEEGINARPATIGITLLHTAALNPDPAFVKLLLEAGADPQLLDDYGRSPLQLAVGHKHLEATMSLMAAGSPIHPPVGVYPLTLSAMIPRDATPLLMACAIGSQQSEMAARVVRDLIAQGSDVNAADRHNRTPLLLAIKSGNLDAIQQLLAAGADVDAVDSNMYGVFHYLAVLSPDADNYPETLARIAQVLRGSVQFIDHSNPHPPSAFAPQPPSPLTVALNLGRWKAIHVLLDMGFRLPQPTGLHHHINAAIEARQPEILEMLLNSTHSIDAPIGTGFWCPVEDYIRAHHPTAFASPAFKPVPIPWSVLNSTITILRLLEDHGILKETQITKSLVAAARWTDSEELVEALIQFGGDLGVRERVEDVPRRGVNGVLERGCRDEMLDLMGIAALSDNLGALRCLVRYIPEIISSASNQSRHWLDNFEEARRAGEDDLDAVLRCLSLSDIVKGSVWNARMAGALITRNLSFIKRLVKHGLLDIHRPLFHGWTPLHIVIQRGKLDLVDFLLSSGVDVDVKTGMWFPLYHLNQPIRMSMGSGEVWNPHRPRLDLVNDWKGTALHFATMLGLKDVVERLIQLGADVNADTYEGFEEGEVEYATMDLCGRRPLDIALSRTLLNRAPEITTAQPLGESRLGIAQMLASAGARLSKSVLSINLKDVHKFKGHAELWDELELGRMLNHWDYRREKPSGQFIGSLF